jgi:hypothetical protein
MIGNLAQAEVKKWSHFYQLAVDGGRGSGAAMEWYQRLAQTWQSHNLLLGVTPVTEESFQAFEDRFSVRIPSDVRRYFQCVNGTSILAGHDMDENGFRFLPLSEVQAVGDFAAEMGWKIDDEILGHQTAFVFVDYLAWCGAYAFETASPNEGAVYLLGYPRQRIVAPTLAKFAELYLKDDDSIYRA